MKHAAPALRAKPTPEAWDGATRPRHTDAVAAPSYLRVGARLGGLHDPEEREAEHAAGVIAAGGCYQVRDPGGSTHLRATGGHGWPLMDPGASGRVRRAADAQAAGAAAAGAAERIERARSAAASPLTPAVQARLQQGLGESLDTVRVHTGSVARTAAAAIGTRAYTEGERITLGYGESEHDLRLMAHEATHVVQNRRAGGIARPTPSEAGPDIRRSPDDDADLRSIDAQLDSMVISDAYRAELEQRRAAIVARQQSDLQALGREAERRREASAGNVSVPAEGPSSVTVPLSAIVTVPEPIDAQTLFSELTADPLSELGIRSTIQYIADQHLAGKLSWPVTVDIIEPGEGVWFNFSVNGRDLVASRSLELPLSALDILSAEPLSAVVKRAVQIVETAALIGAAAEMIAEIGGLPEEMIANPERYARNDAFGLAALASRYDRRLQSLSAALLPQNAWLRAPLARCRNEFQPVVARTMQANAVAARLLRENQPPTYVGETYNRLVEESSNWVERSGWKFWRLLGDAATLGGKSSRAENIGMYRRGEISLNDYKKNWVLVIVKVGFKASLLALTAGRATGPAMRFLGLEGESIAATLVAGQAEGAASNFVDAVSSDLLAKTVATLSSSPGVVAFHKRSIAGPAGWFESAFWGGTVGGWGAFLGSLMPKAPMDVGALQPEVPTAPAMSALGEGTQPEIRIINSDLATGDVTIAVEDPATGQLFTAQGNIHAGNATVTNVSAGEIVGYVREGTFGPVAPGGELLPGQSLAPEAGDVSVGEADVADVSPDVPAAAFQLPPGGAPPVEGPPAGSPAAFLPGKAPRGPGEMTKFLRDAVLSELEIVSFGGEHAQKLGPRTAARVARLAEHFTAPDIKALGTFLTEHDVILDDAMTDAFIEKVQLGKLVEKLLSIEIAEDAAIRSGTKFDLLNEIRLSVTEPRTPRPGAAAEPRPKTGPEMAEEQLGPVLDRIFGPGWEYQPRFKAPGAGSTETLGSTVPEYYHRGLKKAFEVKKFDLEELGIGPEGQRIAPMSERSVKAIERARRQLAARRWNLPEGTEQSIVFNITGQGVMNAEAVGRELQALLLEGFIHYDRVFVQDRSVLTEIR